MYFKSIFLLKQSWKNLHENAEGVDLNMLFSIFGSTVIWVLFCSKSLSTLRVLGCEVGTIGTGFAGCGWICGTGWIGFTGSCFSSV